MRKMHEKRIKAFCLSTFVAATIFSGTVFATDLNVQTTTNYEQWNQLVEEQKEKTLMPKTFSAKLPDEFFESGVDANIPSLLNELKGTVKLRNQNLKLENIEASYSDSSYNIANKLNLRVEHQGSTTECWAFSMLKSVETNIALRSGITEIPDFSERHMDYSTSKTFLDGVNEKGFERELGRGGLPVAALAYLTNGQGAVLESNMPFEDNEEKIHLADIDKEVDTVVTEYVSLPTLTKSYKKDEKGNTISVTYKDSSGKKYTIQQVEKIRETIKKHIVEDGAVPSLTAGNQTKFYNNSKNITKATAYNCNDASLQRDHGITIVGWDDNYSKDNFAEGAKPSTDGAYIALNSYGAENFDEGYLYISYEDFFIESELYVIKNTEKKDYNKIYQSDFYGGIFSMGTTSTDTGFYANTYERNISETEFVTDIGVTVSDYVNLEIYINPQNDSLELEKLIKVGETSEILEPGYHRLKVTPTKLTGENFAIVIKQKSENDIFYFAIETPVENSQYACVDSENNSYYSLNGNIWKNISEIEISGYDMKKSDVCIKAFTTEEEPSNDDLEQEKPNEDNPSQNKPEQDKPNGDNPSENKPEQDKPNGDKPDDNKPNNENKITITSEKYLIGDKDIYKIVSDTSVSEFKKNIKTESIIKILDKDKEVTRNNEIIKTGMKLKLDDTKEYVLIVRGDINCDGKVSLTDLSKLILHYNETKGFILSGNPFEAADMNYDKKVSLTDVSQMIVLYNSK